LLKQSWIPQAADVPKVTLEQVTKFVLSLARGEPNREQIILMVLAGKVREII